MKTKRIGSILTLAVAGALAAMNASAQITNVVFTDDFSKTGIDTGKYAVDSPFFEGGKGTIAPKVENGVLEFTGTVTEQWWAGATLRVIEPIAISPETNVVVTVDRIEETGGTTGSRSALWIMDESRTKYVLYAEVYNEGGWHYNRYIGETGDVRTGGGTNIDPFDGTDAVTGVNYDDQGLHRMQVLANGKTVKLYLDGKYGTEVKFPFDKMVVELGSYARANNDTAGTKWDNLKIQTVGTATFSLAALTLGAGQTSPNLVVRIPPGANADKAIEMKILNKRPAVAAPVGGTAGSLTLTFEKGGPNTKTFDLEGLTIGATQLTLTNSVGLLAGNVLDVTVVKGPTVLLEDDFAASKLDVNKWLVNTQAFETGTGPFQVTQTGGALQIGGIVEAELWPGASIQTLGDFTASKDLPLQLEVDRVTMNRTNYYETDFSTGTRSGVFITSYDNDNKRTTPYVFFSQDLGASESVTGWKVNVSATGDGIALAPLAGWNDDTKNHRMKLLADGSKVEVFLDDVSGGSFDFAVGSYIRFELGTYARSVEDTVKATFDNIKIQNVLPCIAVTPTDVLAIQGDTGNSATVTIPKLLNVGGAVKVTVTSRDPSVAEPQGAVNGVLPLDFATGNNVLSFKILAKSAGNTVFDLQSDSGTCVASGIKVAVTTAPQALMSDDFAAGSIDTAKWTIDPTPLVEGGTMTAESAVKTVDGMAELDVKCEASNWPGYTVWTKTTYAPSVNSPIVFEIDRAKMTYTLVGGDASKQRTGIWIKDAAGHYVFFSEFGSYNAVLPGWQYHRYIGAAGDVVLGAPDTTGTYIAALSAVKYSDQKNHRMRMVANGATVKLYLDGVLGAEVAFPFANGLTFGFGAYANYSNSAGNPVQGYFDNAIVQGFPAAPPSLGSLNVARQANGQIAITWTGTGVLQAGAKLPGGWSDVSPAPTGNTYTVTPAAQTQQYFRLRQ